jgi:hypothetical protein
MSDIPIPWKKNTCGFSKVRRFAAGRAPTIEEIQKICEYPDRRMKAIIYIISSSGIKLGAWDVSSVEAYYSLLYRILSPVTKNRFKAQINRSIY